MIVLLVVTSICTVWFWTYPMWYSYVIGVLWIIRILKLPTGKKGHLLVMTFVTLSYLRLPQTSQIDIQQTSRQVVISANQVNVNGDRLTAQTVIDDEIVTLVYRLSSEEEKKFFLDSSDDLVLFVEGQFEKIEGATGPYQFDYRRYAYEQKRQFYYFNAEQLRVVNTHFNIVGRVRQRIRQVLSQLWFQWVDVLVFGKSWDSDTHYQLQSLGVLWVFSLSGMHVQWLLDSLKKLLYRIGVIREVVEKVQIGVALLCVLLSPNKIGVQKVFWHTLTKKYVLWVMIGYIIYQPYVIYTLSFQLSFGALFLRQLQHAKMTIPLWSVIVLSAHYYQFFYMGYLLVPIAIFFLKKVVLPLVCLSVVLGVFAIPIPFQSIVDVCCLLFKHSLEYLFNGQQFTLVTGRYHYLVYIVIIVIYLFCLNGWQRMTTKQKIGCLFLVSILVVPKPYERLVMLDVGQGDCFIIQKGYNVVMIDTGGRLDFKKENWQKGNYISQFERKVLPVLYGMGIGKLSAVILSHNDSDHSGDLLSVKRHFPGSVVVYGQGAPVISGDLAVVGGMNLTFGDVSLDILYPRRSGKGENEDSLFIYTTIGNQRILFTGDGTVDNEKEVMQLYPNLTVDILKVGHHGSKTSTDLSFIKQLQPKIALISVGQHNRYGHPHSDVLKKLHTTTIYRTDTQGVVIFEVFFGSGQWRVFKNDTE